MVGWATPSLPHPCKAYRIGSLACFGAGTAYFKLSACSNGSFQKPLPRSIVRIA